MCEKSFFFFIFCKSKTFTLWHAKNNSLLGCITKYFTIFLRIHLLDLNSLQVSKKLQLGLIHFL